MTLLATLELSLLAVCIWGFIAVLLTAQFNPLIIVACIAGLIIGYRARRKGWRPSPLSANIVAIIVFVVAGGIMVSTLNLLTATVYLFLFLQVTKYITRQSLAESRWCYVISLFNIIGASVITTTVAFGIMLVVYIFLTLVSLRLYNIAFEWEKALTGGSSKSAASQPPALSPAGERAFQQQPVPRGMYGTGMAWTVVIMLLAGALFSAVPRLATQNLFQTYGPSQDEPAISAFSENVEFGSFTEIQQDDTIALFVQPLKSKRPKNVRMRGVALDTFDGSAWKRTGYPSTKNNSYEFLPIFTTRMYDETYKYRVIQPAGMTNFLFGDSFPLKITLPPSFSFYADPLAQSVYLTSTPSKEFQYEVESMHEDLAQRKDPVSITTPDRPVTQLTVDRPRSDDYDYDSQAEDAPDESFEAVMGRLTGEAISSDGSQTSVTWNLLIADMLTADSEETTFTEDAATETTDPAADDTERLMPGRRWGNRYGYGRRLTGQQALHRYLEKCLALPENLETGRVPQLAEEWTEDAQTTFAKAIAVEERLREDFGYSLTPRASGNYIESFLFDVKEGHCEYFATSMAVLLRNAGIPARVVNGFYSSEWNTLSGNFTVRQKDAHSWVEAWLGDKYGWMTFDPTPPGGVTRRANRGAFLEGISRLSDAARMRWYRYVVDYSITDQTAVVRTLLTWRQRAMQSINNMKILGISAGGTSEINLGNFSGEVDLRILALSAVIILLLIAWQLIRWIKRRRRNRWSSVRFYDELLRMLSRRGQTIAPGQTPLEFARQVSNTNALWADFVHVTQLYYGSRFSHADAKLEPGDVHIITNLKKAIRQKPKQS